MSRKVLLILGQLGALIVGTLRSPIPRSEVSAPPAVRSLSQGQIHAQRLWFVQWTRCSLASVGCPSAWTALRLGCTLRHLFASLRVPYGLRALHSGRRHRKLRLVSEFRATARSLDVLSLILSQGLAPSAQGILNQFEISEMAIEGFMAIEGGIHSMTRLLDTVFGES